MNSDTTTIEQELNVSSDVSTSDVNGTTAVTAGDEGNTSETRENNNTAPSQTNPAPTQTKSVQQTSQQRHENAARRISNQNRQLKQKIAEYEAEIKRLQNSNKPEDVQKVNGLLDKHETFSAIVNNNEREQWEQQAYDTFGDNADTFLSLSDKYGEHINTAEPDVAEYIGTKYGMLLLGEWMKRMELPQYRNEWLQMPRFQKGQVLARFYEQIEQLANGKQTVTSKGGNKPVNLPAVAGGSKTGGNPADSDLSGNIETAFAEFGYKR